MNLRISLYAVILSLIVAQPMTAYACNCTDHHHEHMPSLQENALLLAIPFVFFAAVATYNYYHGNNQNQSTNSSDHEHSSSCNCGHTHDAPSDTSSRDDSAPTYQPMQTQQPAATPTSTEKPQKIDAAPASQAPAPEPSAPAQNTSSSTTPSSSSTIEHIFDPADGTVHDLMGW